MSQKHVGKNVPYTPIVPQLTSEKGPPGGSDMIMADDGLLRGVYLDLTQRLNFNASQDEHISMIIQPTSPETGRVPVKTTPTHQH